MGAIFDSFLDGGEGAGDAADAQEFFVDGLAEGLAELVADIVAVLFGMAFGAFHLGIERADVSAEGCD